MLLFSKTVINDGTIMQKFTIRQQLKKHSAYFISQFLGKKRKIQACFVANMSKFYQ